MLRRAVTGLLSLCSGSAKSSDMRMFSRWLICSSLS